MRILDSLQMIISLALLVMGMRGQGSHATFVGIFLALPLLRAVSGAYRAQVFERVRNMYAEMRRYALHPENESIPWLPLAMLVVIPTACMNFANGRAISSMDNFPINLTAASLVLHATPNVRALTPVAAAGTCQIDPPLTYSLTCDERGVYSNYPAGMLAFAVPVFATARVLGADVNDSYVQWRLAKWMSAWLAAASIALVALINLHFITIDATLIVAGFLATGSALFSTIGQGAWSQGGVIFGCAVFIACEIVPHVRRRRFSPILAGLALTLMAACRLNSAALILPLAVWCFYRAPKRALLVGAVAAIGYAPWAAYYWQIDHNPFGPQLRMGQSHTWGADVLHATVGVLVSPARGLFVYQPWALLALTPLVSRLRPMLWKSLAGVCATGILLHLALLSSWPEWWGGVSWGSRLAAETIPLFAILVGPRIDWCLGRRAGRAMIVILIVASFFFQATGALLDGAGWNLQGHNWGDEQKMFDWTDPPFLYPFRSLVTKNA